MAYQLSAIFNLGGNYIQQMQKAQKETGTMNKSLATVGSGFSKLASLALKAGAVIGLGLGIKDMISKASTAQLRLAQMDAVLKSTSGAAGMSKDALLSLASAQSQLTTYSRGTTVAGENLLLTFTGIGKKVFPDTIKAAQDMSTAMGTDLNSSVMLLGKSLNDPVSGMGRLAKSGVTFTKQQKDQVAAMQKVGNVAGAQALILKELSKEFGGSAAAAGKTFAGQMTILKNNMSGVESSLGMVLIPYLQKFVTFINNNMPKIKQIITDAMTVVAKVFKKVSDFIASNLIPIFDRVKTWVTANMPQIKQGISDMSVLVVDRFKKIVNVVNDIVNKFFPSLNTGTDGVKLKFSDLRDGVYNLVKQGFDILITALTWIKDNSELVKLAVKALTAVWVIQRLKIIANNTVLAINNGLLFIAMARTKLKTGYLVALYVAEGIATGIAWLYAAGQTAINLAMDVCPILALVALIAILITNWDKVTKAIGGAFDKLEAWNKAKIADKTATVTTVTKGGTGGLNDNSNGNYGSQKINPATGKPYAGGTIYATKGEHWVGEKGPEKVNFKGGETVKSAKDSKNVTDGKTFIINNYFNGNVGSDEFFDQAGEKVSKRILMQLANM